MAQALRREEEVGVRSISPQSNLTPARQLLASSRAEVKDLFCLVGAIISMMVVVERAARHGDVFGI